ncbi:MAG: DUF1104 domain-containing protein [Epsilonproteobacteria bacterium]|nr:DUF1104 domain-containing protein [Campylobacterota bacterium]
MRKILFVLFFIVSLAIAAKVDYSSMSTQELLAMIGYVPTKNITTFNQEIDKRLATMSVKEKKIYKKNIRKMQK